MQKACTVLNEPQIVSEKMSMKSVNVYIPVATFNLCVVLTVMTDSTSVAIAPSTQQLEGLFCHLDVIV